MKIKLTILTDKIENEDYLQDLETIKYAEVAKSKTKLKEFATKMVKEVVAALKHESLVQTKLEISGQRPITFLLETNIINLPYSNYKKIANFFEEEQEYPVQVYFETASEYLNASGFRIDLLASQEELLEKPNEVIDKLVEQMQEKIKTVREYQKSEAKKATQKTKTTNKTKKKSSK